MQGPAARPSGWFRWCVQPQGPRRAFGHACTSVLTWGGASCAVQGGLHQATHGLRCRSPLYWCGVCWDELWEIVLRAVPSPCRCKDSSCTAAVCLQGSMGCPRSLPPGGCALSGGSAPFFSLHPCTTQVPPKCRVGRSFHAWTLEVPFRVHGAASNLIPCTVVWV